MDPDIVNAIKRNVKILNAVVLLVLYVLLFLNIRFLYRFLDYIPKASIIAMLAIIAALVAILFLITRTVASTAIGGIDKYEKRLSGILNSMKQEVVERRKIEKQLEEQVYYDQLTNLPNRNLFLKQLNRISERPQRYADYLFAVLFIDVDDFKNVNDSLGHITGDELLISIAQRMRTCVRPSDVIARFGGDEFAILIDDIQNISDALAVADRILAAVKLPFQLHQQELFITVSIGIAHSAMGYTRIEDYLRNADTAMYRAKAKGKARYEMFDIAMHNAIMDRLKLESELRKAVETKEFLILYQPIVSVADFRIVGAEALVRWQHPQHGIISPMKFIPLAESMGLITKIDEWVLREASAQNRAWHEAGHRHFRMNVNFSALQFQRENLLETIEQILHETDMNARFLDIEITESIAMEDQSIPVLNELSRIGLRTSIDDFGTGYSSLGSLKRFPINSIKIDKSFLKDIHRNEDAGTIVKAIISLAHTMKMKVIAEGVETEDQLAFLQFHGCDESQGYLFSPPVSANRFTRLLKKSLVSSKITNHEFSYLEIGSHRKEGS